MKGLILCAGKGTRLRPYTYSRPKPLLPVGNKPVIEHIIDKMHLSGICDVGIVVPPLYQSQFQDVLGLNHKGVNLHFIEQREPKGLADAVQSARSFLHDEAFLVVLGDIYFSGDLACVIEPFQSGIHDAVVLIREVRDPTQFGVAQINGSQVVRLVEKPAIPISPYALTGVYVLTRKIFEVIERLKPSARGEYELTDAIQGLVENGLSVQAVITKEWWKDTGSPINLLACNRKVLMGLPERGDISQAAVHNSFIDGPVVTASGVEIIDSTIRGPVVIGAGSRIVKSYVGRYTSIGNEVHIESSEIENSIVLERSHIKRISQRIDESIIGCNVKLERCLKLPKTLKIHVGDDSQLYVPFEEH